MSKNLTTKILCVLAFAALAGCRQDALSQADNRVLFDREGCAFIVRSGVGNTSAGRRFEAIDGPREAQTARRG